MKRGGSPVAVRAISSSTCPTWTTASSPATADRSRKEKGGPDTRTARKCQRSLRLRGGRLVFLAALLHRPRIEALGAGVAIDELDHRDRGVVAIAKAGLENAQITALAVLVART